MERGGRGSGSRDGGEVGVEEEDDEDEEVVTIAWLWTEGRTHTPYYTPCCSRLRGQPGGPTDTTGEGSGHKQEGVAEWANGW